MVALDWQHLRAHFLSGCLSIASEPLRYVFRSLRSPCATSFDRLRCLSIARRGGGIQSKHGPVALWVIGGRPIERRRPARQRPGPDRRHRARWCLGRWRHRPARVRAGGPRGDKVAPGGLMGVLSLRPTAASSSMSGQGRRRSEGETRGQTHGPGDRNLDRGRSYLGLSARLYPDRRRISSRALPCAPVAARRPPARSRSRSARQQRVQLLHT